MTEMNDIEVLLEIRENHDDLLGVVITAHDTIERAVEAIESGADEFIIRCSKTAGRQLRDNA